MAAWTVIVPLETIADVVCDADVMSLRISVTSQDVDDSLLDPVHLGCGRMDQASKKLEQFC